MAAIENGRGNESKYWNGICQLKERKHENKSNQALSFRVFYFPFAALALKHLQCLKMESAGKDLLGCKKGTFRLC